MVKLPAGFAEVAPGVGIALQVSACVVLFAAGAKTEACLLSVIGSLVLLAGLHARWRALDAHRPQASAVADESHNCARCGKHQPEPPALLVVQGRLVDETGRPNPGVCIVWCRPCAAVDSAYATAVRCCREHDAAGLTDVLRTVARRGPGRLTWVSQAVVDSLNAATAAETTEERTMH